MKVMVEDQEVGIFLSFKEWNTVKKSLGDFSDWMDQQAEPSIFELSDEEVAQRLQPTAENLVQRALAKGLYFSMQGPEPNQFIHQYADGSQELISIDEQSGKSRNVSSR